MNTVTVTDARYAIVAGKFNHAVTEQLVAAAAAEFKRHGVGDDRVDCVWVPGAFEIPFACRKLIAKKSYAAIVALGAVIRGETPHFDFVAGECARGVAELNLTTDTPVIFGVLTTDTAEQAFARADPNKKNKGGEAARAAMEMVGVVKKL